MRDKEIAAKQVLDANKEGVAQRDISSVSQGPPISSRDALGSDHPAANGSSIISLPINLKKDHAPEKFGVNAAQNQPVQSSGSTLQHSTKGGEAPREQTPGMALFLAGFNPENFRLSREPSITQQDLGLLQSNKDLNQKSSPFPLLTPVRSGFGAKYSSETPHSPSTFRQNETNCCP